MPFVGSVQDLHWSIALIRPDYFLLVKTQGPIDSHSWPVFGQAVAAAAAVCQCTHVLLDHRESNLAFSTLDTYENPLRLLSLNPPPALPCALVFVRPSEQTQFLDDRFANTGARAHIFYDFDRAQRWLQTVIRTQKYFNPSHVLSPDYPPPPHDRPKLPKIVG